VKPHKKPDLNKVNVTLTIGPKLSAASKLYARENEMSFSELVALLLRRELATPSISVSPPKPPTDV